MYNMWTLLGFSIIFHLLGSTNGQPFNGTDWRTEIPSDTVYEQQLHMLKLENENLKLRLEFVELHMMTQQNYNIKTERKLESIEDQLKKLNQYESTNISANALSVKEDPKVGANLSLRGDAGKMDSSRGEHLADKEENSVQSVDMNITQNMLREIQSTLAKIESKYSTEPQHDLITAMLNLIVKDNLMTCMRNGDNKLVCFEDNFPTSCANCSTRSTNSCRIQNRLLSTASFVVPCNGTTDGGGWTVIQRRVNGAVDFFRDWSEYKQGFGDLDANYWIGLDKLHALTTTLAPVELRIEMMDFANVFKYAKYNSFRIGNESTKYILEDVAVYSGNAGDSFSNLKGHMFSTRDQDNDVNASLNCAQDRHGAWWYSDCSRSNFNGKYYNVGSLDDGKAIYWTDFHTDFYSLKFVQMMIRPKMQ